MSGKQQQQKKKIFNECTSNDRVNGNMVEDTHIRAPLSGYLPLAEADHVVAHQMNIGWTLIYLHQ